MQIIQQQVLLVDFNSTVSCICPCRRDATPSSLLLVMAPGLMLLRLLLLQSLAQLQLLYHATNR